MILKRHILAIIAIAILALVFLFLSYVSTKNFGEKIEIIDTSHATESEPNHEFIVLKVKPRPNELINLSNVYLENNEGLKLKLPQSSVLPIQGTINDVQDIIINKKTIVMVTTGRAPLGVSFQENKCLGYLGQFQNYYPPLKKECPSQTDTIARHEIGLLPECNEYIESLPACETKLYDFTENVAPSCQVIVRSYVHYNSCVEAHQNDSNFYLPVWRLYLDHATEFWSDKDIVKIFDENDELLDIHQIN